MECGQNPQVRAARSASRNSARDDADDDFAKVLRARMNCGKHALETSNPDHIAAPLLGERQSLSCVTAYRKQTRAALKRGN
jgi:hypothetical protein